MTDTRAALVGNREGGVVRSTVVLVAEEMSFRDKIRTIGVVGLSSSPKVKRTVDEHGTHNVVVSEHATKDDRVDVTVTPPTVHRTRS